MAERFRVSFPQPPFGFLIRQMFGESSFRDDVKLLGDIAADQRTTVKKVLDKATFANRSTFRDAVAAAGVEDAEEVTGILYRLASMVREADTTIPGAKSVFESALEKSDIDESHHAAIINAFDELCLKPRSLDMQTKAERLASATGYSIESLSIVCDIRPVFDGSHDAIVGVLPYYTMRIEYDDGESQKIDLRLTDHGLENLGKEVDRAVRKRAVMNKAMESNKSWKIAEVDE